MYEAQCVHFTQSDRVDLVLWFALGSVPVRGGLGYVVAWDTGCGCGFCLGVMGCGPWGMV